MSNDMATDDLAKEADIDPAETEEWIAALSTVIANDGTDRAHYLIESLIHLARRRGANLPYKATTSYVNTIHPTKQQPIPGDAGIEARIRSYIRWNALAMVVRANMKPGDLGGHIASFASAAVLYDIGFNYFFRAQLPELADSDFASFGDFVYFQGHSAPGIYARAFLEGRISEAQLDSFRCEVSDEAGLSSYPHPWLMPNFWQFPTVSMGLGPIMAIYQARFTRYLENRELIPRSSRKVWAFMGDGEMDEPEALGAITLAAREQLDNLIFVVNCNLQRLDGPVRGNGKIIQELEAIFRGAGWNVIKVIWGSYWDPLLFVDKTGILRRRMEEALDGDYQTYRANSGSYIRDHFFGKYPQLREMVSKLTDEDIWRLNRGGHDPHKVYAAYHEAFHHTGQPTVILAKTIKGYGMGDAGEARNVTHQRKKISLPALKRIRDRFRIPISDADIEDIPYYRPPEDSEEMQYLRERVNAMGGSLPARRSVPIDFSPMISLESLGGNLLADSGDRAFSTTMAFVRLLNTLVKDKTLGPRIVPIVADESRTFGMEGLFRQLGIYSILGQQYRPEDADELMYYREDERGQILQEGICEAGAFSSWIAASCAYTNHGCPMIPFYIFYSMFGFQRIGDLAWAAGDARARGFLLGGTSGRTTLNGEGLQHEDGHSHIIAQTIPNCRSYDPTFAYELAVILHDGLVRMYVENTDCYYYITLMNENYPHAAMPEGSREDILRGMYRFCRIDADTPAAGKAKKSDKTSKGAKEKKTNKAKKADVRLLGSGAIFQEVLRAAEILAAEFSLTCDIYSVTSFNLLARDAQDVERYNLLNPKAKTPKTSHLAHLLGGDASPIIAASDYMKLYAQQIAAYVTDAPMITLGTDGYGRSDTREQLRAHFEVSRDYIAYSAIVALHRAGAVDAKTLTRAHRRFGIDGEKINPISA